MELPQLDALIYRAVSGIKLFMYPPNVTGDIGLEAMRHDKKRTHVSWKLEYALWTQVLPKSVFTSDADSANFFVVPGAVMGGLNFAHRSALGASS